MQLYIQCTRTSYIHNENLQRKHVIVNMYFFLQKKVYDALGVAVLKNAWEGYNSTLFAYGQTGSGKSWSVVGYGINKGKHMAITGIN